MADLKTLAAKREELLQADIADYNALTTEENAEKKAGIRERLMNRKPDLAAATDAYNDAREAKTKEQELAEMKNRGANEPFGAGQPEVAAPGLTLGEALLQSESVKAWYAANRPSLKGGAMLTMSLPDWDGRNFAAKGAEFKTTMTTSAGWAVPQVRAPGYVPSAQIRPTLADFIPQGTMSNPVYRFMVESTFTNNADVVAEGASKPAAALALTETTATASKIAITLPVTEEQLEDVPEVTSYVNDRLPLMVKIKEEYYILNGTAGGTGDNFYGFQVISGTSSQAKSTDSIPTAFLKAFTKVRYGSSANVMNAEPTLIGMHPTDYQSYALLQATTGQYILGEPAGLGAPINDPYRRMWGVPILVTPAFTQGTGLTGDFANFARLLFRKGLTADMGWANDDFLKNLVRFRVEERLTLAVLRPSAFCLVTGM
jgi:HK97 family phage major capsid protein